MLLVPEELEIVFERELRWRSRYVLTVNRTGQVVARVPEAWPEAKINRMLHRHRRWLLNRREEQVIRKGRQAEQERLKTVWSALPESWYRRAARKVLKERCDHWAKVMGLGYGKLRLTGARTRWGSCNARGDLSFSWRLLATRWDLVNYVVVHELAHRVHFDHSQRFWRLVERYVPDYGRCRDDLRELGAALG